MTLTADSPLAVATAADPRDPYRRLESLADPGTLAVHERVGAVLTATARVAGVHVHAFATDPRVRGGALDLDAGTAIAATIDRAVRDGSPVVGLWESGGARLDEGAPSLHGMGLIFAASTRASGRVLQLSVVLGAAAGGAAYGPALTDLVVLGPGARVFVTGPDVVRSITGESTDAEHLGGPEPHSRHSGLAHIVAADEPAALHAARELLHLFAGPPVGLAAGPRPDPATLLPESPRRAYDVRPLLAALLDRAPLELQPRWAPNMVTAVGRLGGRAVGVIATNPLRLGGCLDATSAEKAARFVRLCDGHRVPLLVVVDTPGFLPGVHQEHGGVVRRGAKLLHAFADATVPRVTVVTRKAYGGAYIAMNSRSLGATAVLAWPDAEIGVMGEMPAVKLLHRRELAAATAEDRPALEAELAASYRQRCGGLATACREGYVDAVVAPGETRAELLRLLTPASAGDSAPWPTRNIPL